MKKILLALFILIYVDDVRGDYWTQKASMPGAARWIATGFSIGNKGYIGTGGISGSPGNFLDDFWEFDPSSNAWTQKANFGGSARWGAVGFSIGAKGYICGGYGGGSGLSQDLWEWDQVTDIWTQKSSLPGPGREFFAGFSIDNKGYVGTGYAFSGHLQDFWEWNQPTNMWTQKNNFSGSPRRDLVGFSIGSKGYIGTGYDGSAVINDFWEWDPVNDVWTQMANVGGGPRNVATAFSFCNFGYIGTGAVNGTTTNDLWQWNQLTNIWSQKANFAGTPREHAVGFSINNKGYIGTGTFYSSGPFILYNDLWEYTPDTSCTTRINNPQSSIINLQLSPNPAKDFISIRFQSSSKAKTKLTITNVAGKIVYADEAFNSTNKISIAKFAKGIYTVQLSMGNHTVSKKFVKE